MPLSDQVTALATRVAQEIKAMRTGGETVPSGGSAGYVLTRPASGNPSWQPIPGAGGVTVYRKAADQDFTTTTLADITDLAIPLPANAVVTIDGIIVFQSAAAQTGFGFAATPRTLAGLALTPNKFLVVFEYQTSATGWSTFTQTVPTTPMSVTTSSYVAGSGILCRITGQIDVGPVAGTLYLQARTEVAGSAITVRKGSPIRVM